MEYEIGQWVSEQWCGRLAHISRAEGFRQQCYSIKVELFLFNYKVFTGCMDSTQRELQIVDSEFGFSVHPTQDMYKQNAL